MQVFKTELEKAAPEFDVQLHFASSLFRQGTEVPAMQRGNLEMSTMTTFEVAQQVPELGFFNRAYLFRDYDHAYKTLTGPVVATDLSKEAPPASGLVRALWERGRSAPTTPERP